MSTYKDRISNIEINMTDDLLDFKAMTHPKELIDTLCICSLYHSSCKLNRMFCSSGYACEDLIAFSNSYKGVGEDKAIFDKLLKWLIEIAESNELTDYS